MWRVCGASIPITRVLVAALIFCQVGRRGRGEARFRSLWSNPSRALARSLARLCCFLFLANKLVACLQGWLRTALER